jgi:hypothetical protein
MTTGSNLTVLLSVYNDHSRLGRAIESILAQTFRSFDLLIVDDGSTDRSNEVAATYAARDSRVRILSLPVNVGLSAALQAGLKETSADFVARMDSDDIAHPTRLALQLAHMENEGLDVLGAAQDRGKGWIFNNLKPQTRNHAAIVRALPHHNVFIHPSVIFRVATVHASGGYDPRFNLAQDYDLWLRLIGQARFGNLSKKLIFSPPNPDRASGPKNRTRHTLFSVTAAANHFRRGLGLVGLDPHNGAVPLGRDLVFLLDQVEDVAFFDLCRHAIRYVRYCQTDQETRHLIRDRILSRANLKDRMKWWLYKL